MGYQASEAAKYQRKLAESWLHTLKVAKSEPSPNTVGGLFYYRIAMRRQKRDGDFPLEENQPRGNWGRGFPLFGVVVV